MLPDYTWKYASPRSAFHRARATTAPRATTHAPPPHALQGVPREGQVCAPGAGASAARQRAFDPARPVRAPVLHAAFELQRLLQQPAPAARAQPQGARCGPVVERRATRAFLATLARVAALGRRSRPPRLPSPAPQAASASYDREAEARLLAAQLQHQREGHLIFCSSDLQVARHHMTRMRAELLQQRQARLELQDELVALKANWSAPVAPWEKDPHEPVSTKMNERASRQAENLGNLARLLAQQGLSPRGTITTGR